jgi:hypothetical protein
MRTDEICFCLGPPCDTLSKRTRGTRSPVLREVIRKMSALSIPELSAPLPRWQAMSVERYAAFEQATHVNVVRIGEIWWQQVRPFFYRPLLPFKKYDLAKAKEGFDRIGVFQTAIADRQSSNSYLNPIVYERPQEYDARALRDSARKNLNKALRNPIAVRCIVDEEQFSELAYPVYLSFYKRTKYRFDTSRKDKAKFIRWVHSVFQFPEAIVLGAFVSQELVSFEIACLVENTLILKTLVTSDKALRLNAPDLLLHYFRAIAQDQPEIQMIYDSMLSANSGLNNYKIRRGARVAALPAFLHIHPALLWLIKKGDGTAYERLRGLNNEQLTAKGLAIRRKSEVC